MTYQIGINVNDSAASTVAKVTPILKRLGVQTVRLWASVSDFGSHAYKAVFQRAIDYSNAGFDVTMEVNTAGGKITSPSAVKGWFAWVAGDAALKNAVDRWEIGNEPDGSSYWKGTLAQYVDDYLKPAYESLHAAGETVVSAGPSWNPQDVQTLIDAGMLNYTDYVGFHPYAHGVAQLKARVAELNAIVAGRKPLAATEWNIRGLTGNPTAWARAVEDAYPTIEQNFALNYYFAMKVQDSPAGPASILTTSFGVNQPFYAAFATFKSQADALAGGDASTDTGTISGTLFNDDDADGTYDPAETVTGSRVVYLDANANGKLDNGEVTTASDAQGRYTFAGLAAGTYDVGRVFPAGYALSNSTLGYVPVTVAAGARVSGVNLGTTATTDATPTVPTGLNVTGLELIDAATDEPVGTIDPITGNVTIDASLLPAGGVNLKVDTDAGVGSVRITTPGKTEIENNTPFSVFGDVLGHYAARTLAPGNYTVVTTAYAGNNASGTVGSTFAATIRIV